ncbi:bifunctional AAA+ ATPase domain/P-loop containing nucleoside triphosphate hydrolase/ATPase [Babesia duncani]|uniref:Origin recognition complex subunit 1 n=1 Tax=Babesia duncani TaxID=323732 RepID=A0AAD9UNM0_9APIC|nr:bifunctional AAA+ ATPase domain/P-loop containing nucleoside triphosphate hydrolase/ATPase [Babesia duncani]
MVFSSIFRTRDKRRADPPEKAEKKKKIKVQQESSTSDYQRKPYGDVVVIVDGKKFYKSVSIDGEIISINDSVDVLRSFRNHGVRLTNLAKIASLYENEDNVLMAEVSFYIDSAEKTPYLTKCKGSKGGWTGFSHDNEVVAFNKFEEVEVESFDEMVTVHSSFEDYEKAIASGEDEEINVFCRFICYNESYSVVPFNTNNNWKKIMCESSKYHSLYHNTPIEVPPAPVEEEIVMEESLKIVGREKEAEAIRTFIETGIRQGGTGQTLYISGVPGSGKTVTVGMVTRELSKKKFKGQIPWFNLIEINAVHLSTPNELYRALYKKLFGKQSPQAFTCYKQLNNYFSNNTTPCVLILDEVDYIVTSTQKVLFTLFDWPTKKSSKLILVIISNTMDLTSRMKPSCASRLAFGSLVFKPYQYQQILHVIQNKVGLDSNVDPVALQLCARRVTNYCGDIRKALQICKLAIKEANGGLVRTSDMNRISNMVLNSSVVDALQFVSSGMKCLLVALVLELRDTQLSIACALNVFNAFKGMMATINPQIGPAISRDSFKHLLLTGVNVGIISLEPTLFASVGPDRRKRIYKDINEDLGDTGIVPQVDIGQIVTALSKDDLWEPKLRNL